MKAVDFGIDGHNFGQILARFAYFAEGFVVTDNSHTLKGKSGFFKQVRVTSSDSRHFDTSLGQIGVIKRHFAKNSKWLKSLT